MRKEGINTRRRSRLWSSATRMLLLSLGLLSVFGVALHGEEAEQLTASLPDGQPVQVRAIEMREVAPGAEIRIEADSALIWTQYRGLDDSLVIEMPNTRALAGVQDLMADSGLISEVTVEEETSSRRPLLRLVIATRGEAQHSLEREEGLLVLRFVPTGEQASSPEVEREPLDVLEEPRERFADKTPDSTLAVPRPAAEADKPTHAEERAEAVQTDTPPAVGNHRMEPEVAEELVAANWPGTADEPYRAPPPVGVRASHLEFVRVLESGAETSLLVAGDGAFSYKAFRLDNPDRFVIDLEGVVAAGGESSLTVASATVERVRMAQYQSNPEPISRVVFDLSRPVLPVISGSSEGLTVRFPALSAPQLEVQPQDAPTPISATPIVVPAEIPTSVAAEAADEPVAEPVDEPIDEDVLLAGVDPGVEPELPTFELSLQRDAIEEEVAVTEEEVLEEVAVAAPEPEAEVPEAKVIEAPVIASVAPTAGLESGPETALNPDEASVALAQAGLESEAVAAERATAEFEIAQIAATGQPPAQPPLPEAEPVVEEELVDESESFVIERSETAEPPRDETLVEGDGVLRPGFGTRNFSGQKQYYGEPISLSVRNADITEILRTIARISGLNMVIQPGISGGVTVELEAVPWDQALEQILKLHQLGMELDGNILRVAPINTLAAEADAQMKLQAAKAMAVPLSTIMRKVSYAQAGELAQILRSGRGGQGVLSQRGSVVVDNRTNTLIIQELPGNLDAVLDIVQNLDTPEDQVMIEARIVETSKTWSRSLGIEWDFSGVSGPSSGNTTGLQFPNNGSIDGGANLFTGGNNGFLNIGLGNVLNTFELDVALIAAENEGLVNVISAPKIATLNNERASIQSGLQIPIQTVANNTVTVQFVNATLRLDVTPHVTADGTILMEIQIQKREPQLAFAVVGATNAPIATREARTRVLVRDGGTTVIGGIYEVSTDESEDRVPGLAEIPVLGRLFKNKDRRNENEELLIFITPRVIRF